MQRLLYEGMDENSSQNGKKKMRSCFPLTFSLLVVLYSCFGFSVVDLETVGLLNLRYWGY
jgi:hypothetical protein